MELVRPLELKSNSEIATLKNECANGRNPREAKVLLAKEIVERFHTSADADAAEVEFNNRFRAGEMPSEIPEVNVAAVDGEIGIGKLIKEASMVPSVGEANRNVDQGGVRVNGDRVTDRGLKLKVGTYTIQVGKRKWAKGDGSLRPFWEKQKPRRTKFCRGFLSKGRIMIGLLQRVKNASVTVNEQVIGAVKQGLLVLVCAEKGDSAEQCEKLAKKVLAYRIFEDENGKMNKSVSDIGGEILIVSQFTLAADTAKGLRPSFTPAADPETGKASL